MKKTDPALSLYLAWLVALVGTLGSLYYSEIRQLVPCLLCWYQRIVLYPLVIIIPIGLVLRDRYLPYYCLALSLIGLLIASYHNLLQFGLIPEKLAPCTAGVSCATKQIVALHIVTIPILSFLAFLLISLAMAVIIKQESKR